MVRIFIYSLLTMVAGCVFLNACQSGGELDKARYYINGKSLYETHCRNCHGDQGEGLGRLYPPLTDTLFMRAYQRQLACLIKYGSSGQLTVGGQVYDAAMPANPRLSDTEIAYLITYISNSFGNHHGIKRDTSVRTELQHCRANQ